MIPRRAALLTALAAAACAPDPGGEEGGIGGTGLRRAGRPPPRPTDRAPDEGGIGGTGLFGTLDLEGGARINGVRLAIGSNTALEGAPASGDCVAAEAPPLVGSGPLAARRVAVFHPLVGRLERNAAGGLAVLGTAVELAPDAPMRRHDGAPVAGAPIGRRVAVSGLWRRETVVATSVTVLAEEPEGESALRGLLRLRNGRYAVGGTPLDLSAVPDARGRLAENRFVTFRGEAAPTGLRVRTLEGAPLGVFAGRVDALSVEGFLAADPEGLGLHLSGFGLPLDPSGPAGTPLDQRRVFLGRLRDRFRVEASLRLPSAAAARAQALAGEAAAAAIARWLAR